MSNETTTTTLNELTYAVTCVRWGAYEEVPASGTKIVTDFYLAPLDVRRVEERKRMREGFGRFARVMEEVWRCLLQRERQAQLLERYTARQRMDGLYGGMKWDPRTSDGVLRAEMSAEWSRRVREGVKALPPTGPRVYCQTEED